MIDFLCFSTTNWDEIWGSRQQIMKRLAAAGNRVLFVERQVGPEHLVRDRTLRARWQAGRRRPSLRQVGDRIWLWQPPLMPPGRYYSQVLGRLGQHLLATRVRPVLQQLGFRDPILWLYPPHSAPLIGRFAEQLVVYHCIDRFVGGQSGRKRKVMLAQETALLKQADVVFVHAEGLRRLYAPLSRRIVLVPSAADVAHYQSTDLIHPDLASFPHPRLGLMGTLDGRVDVALLEAVAQARPDWHLILIGPIRPGRISLDLLLSLPNVYYLGARAFSDLPSLLNGMDVLLVPYVRGESTDFISPIKIYEYLAVGKPIVSVGLPEVRALTPSVSIADSFSEFVAAIDQALRDDTLLQQQERRQVARQHTWDIRLQVMQQTIGEVLAERSDGTR